MWDGGVKLHCVAVLRTGWGIHHNTRLVDAWIDEDSDTEYPGIFTIIKNSERKAVPTKHLIGADGAHSVVRQFGIASGGRFCGSYLRCDGFSSPGRVS